jgi:hypothetical protein
MKTLMDAVTKDEEIFQNVPAQATEPEKHKNKSDNMKV